ncbi:hypothetical protein Lfu02_51620 [Longispora fulva]|uniref:Thioesterase superfamily protein n=1 Tax=Longispora fulva TaxID=619741 RepID=A0A8J7KMV6_9ACTN|nr:hypothetical protein [Longispora fulva]MBG6140944.1 hypothetical protein [Longispora fulva]GIG60790.1 hypothetical protein Lfu02_51620 [Longispora fulva]
MLIDGRFCGPPDSGNGGYTSGLLAGLVPGVGPGDAVEVTLRKPPPLDVELRSEVAGRRAVLHLPGADGDAPGETVADAEWLEPGRFDVEPVPWTAERGVYPGHTRHPFPSCYVCGPDNKDGLHIYPGRIAPGRTAADWLVPDDVSSATVWAALDCPGGWTIQLEERPSVLGRFAVRIDALPAPGSECVIVGELRGAQGRKSHPVTSLYDPSGQLLAVARATWIALA